MTVGSSAREVRRSASDSINQRFVFAKTFEGVDAGDRANAAHARSDRFVAGDFEDADVAGGAHVCAAAKLFRENSSAPLIESTRTFSPYFSPNRAIAPERIASSIAISSVCTGSLRRM